MSEFGELRIGDHVGFLSGFPFSSEYFNGEKGVRLIRIRDLLGSDDNAIYFSGPFDRRWLMEQGDVLIGMDGDFNIVRWKSEPALLNQRILKVEDRPNSKIAHDYFYYWCAPRLLQIHARTAATTVKHLSVRDLERAVGNFPSVEEQRRIATILSTLDEVIEATEKLVEKHQQIKAGLMHDLFTRGLWTRPELTRGDHEGLPSEASAKEGQLRPTPEEAPGLYQESPLGLIPKAWEAASLLSISNSMTNGFVGTATPYYSEDENAVQYLYGNNVRADKLELPSSMRVTRRFHELQRKSQLQPGDMLTVQSGHIGTSAVVPESLGEANCHALIITKFKTSRVVPDFVSYYCNSPGGYRRLGSIFVGSTILHINVKEFKNFAIPLPQDLSEQESICARLVAINERLDTETTHLAKLRQQKQGLMHDLLTGRVRVAGERGFDSPS